MVAREEVGGLVKTWKHSTRRFMARMYVVQLEEFQFSVTDSLCAVIRFRFNCDSTNYWGNLYRGT